MFAGKPLRYDPARRLIWSVGPDEVDDGGDGIPDTTRKWVWKDIVLQIPNWCERRLKSVAGGGPKP